VESAEEIARRPRFSDTTINWITLFVLVAIWGSTFALLRVGVETIAPAWLVTGRLGGAALALGLWMLGAGLLNPRTRWHGRARMSMRTILLFSLIGVAFTALPFLFYSTAAETTGSAVMAICNGGTPFVTAVLAHIMLKDRLTPRRVVGVLLGFAGLAVLVLPEFGAGPQGSLFGVSLAIAGAALYAGGYVGTRIAPPVSPTASTFVITLSGAAAALIAAPLIAPFPTNPSVASLLAMVCLAVLPTAFAMMLNVWLIQRSGAVFGSFVTYLSPLWATVLGVLFLGEPLHLSMVGALALILIGVAVANRPVRR
jgi:drug/metabolite transporter (DMT)-like permease